MIRDNVFKLLYSLGVPTFLRFGKSNQLTILSLHRISPERDFFFDPIDPAVFDKLLGYVKSKYEVISFQELTELTKFPNKPLLILSFDDGYFDFYEYALPILKKHNLPSNHNIVNECASFNSLIWTQRLNYVFNYAKNNQLDLTVEVDAKMRKLSDFGNNWQVFYLQIFKQLLNLPRQARNEIIEGLENKHSVKAEYRMMNWEEIKDCSVNNVEIGSHTYSHDVLSTIEDPMLLIHEIEGSKKEIEEKIKKSVSIIALPNGQGTQNVNEVIRKSGFQYLLYVNDQTNKLQLNLGANQFQTLNRINLLNENYPEMVLRSELFHQKMRK